jgi:hypothetical protein
VSTVLELRLTLLGDGLFSLFSEDRDLGGVEFEKVPLFTIRIEPAQRIMELSAQKEVRHTVSIAAGARASHKLHRPMRLRDP